MPQEAASERAVSVSHTVDLPDSTSTEMRKITKSAKEVDTEVDSEVEEETSKDKETKSSEEAEVASEVVPQEAVSMRVALLAVATEVKALKRDAEVPPEAAVDQDPPSESTVVAAEVYLPQERVVTTAATSER